MVLSAETNQILTTHQVVVWGDQHDPAFSDYFCEKSFLSHIVKYLSQRDCPSRVQVQVIQSLGILVGNTKSTQMIFYLLSNNHINDLIVHPLDFHIEEVLSHYISFLKTLSLRLDLQTIQVPSSYGIALFFTL